MKKMIAAIAISLFPLVASTASADSRYEPVTGINSLTRLEGTVSLLVKKYYPDATSNSFKDTVHFEHATRLFVVDALAKVPAGTKRPKEAVRAPKDGGIWCDLAYVHQPKPPYQRGEGAIDRKGFIEHRYYPEDAEGAHLIVTLRLPKNSDEREKKFVVELRKHLESQHDFLERQAAMPAGQAFPLIDMEEALRKLESANRK